MELNYYNFNRKKFLRKFKKICDSSVYLGRFKITQKDKELINNYTDIQKYLSSIVKNPIVFSNGNIYIVISEIEAFLTTWDEFKEIIQNVASIEGLKERQQKFIEVQNIILNHFKEIFEYPERKPSYLQNERQD